MRRRDLLLLGCTPFMPAMAEGRNRRLDLSAYEVSFATEFGDSQRPLLKSDGGPFSSRFEEWGGLRTLPGNKEEELYVDAGFIPAPEGTDELGRADARPGAGNKPLGVNPFSLSDGALAITAIPTPSTLRTSVDRPYLSGMICTDRSFAQRFGYFEMRARLPVGRGLWPAFWLVAKTQQEHLEVDIMEAVGWDTTHVYQSTHLKASRGKGIHIRVGSEGFDYTAASRSYGVEWTPQELVFYIDGLESARANAGLLQDAPPMYMIANLAVGGDWAGTPDGGTHFPAVMHIDHIRAYRPK
jgi:beta-glucanase (GH16 family)